MSDADQTRPEIPSRKTPIPAEQLLWLEESPSTRYQQLVDDEGSIALAAYTLATWRIAAGPTYMREVPSKSDLNAAARTIRRHLRLERVPSGNVLVAECRAAGRRVI